MGNLTPEEIQMALECMRFVRDGGDAWHPLEPEQHDDTVEASRLEKVLLSAISKLEAP